LVIFGDTEIEPIWVVDKKQPSRPLVMFDVTINSDYGREAQFNALTPSGRSAGYFRMAKIYRPIDLNQSFQRKRFITKRIGR
jgi:hypothetical protein